MDIKKDWPDIIIKGYNQGYSDVEICKELNITPRQFNRALKDSPAFSEIIEYGRMLASAWWSSQARSGLVDKQFNTPLYIMYMKNHQDWRDKIETTAVDSVDSATLADMKKRLIEALPKYIDKLKELPQLELIEDTDGSE